MSHLLNPVQYFWPLGGGFPVESRYLLDEVSNSIAIAPLVVIPGEELNHAAVEYLGEGRVENGREAAADNVCGHDRICFVVENPWKDLFGCCFDRFVNHFSGYVRFQFQSEIHDAAIGYWNPHSYAIEFAV